MQGSGSDGLGVFDVELVRRPGEGPEAARSRAMHRLLPGPPGLSLLEVRADTTPQHTIEAHVSVALPPDTLLLVVGLAGLHHGGRRHRRPEREVSPERYTLAAVGAGEWSVHRAPGSREHLLIGFLSCAWLEQQLGPYNLAAPFVDIARDRGSLGHDGATPMTSATMRRIALELLSTPYQGDLQRLAVTGKSLELLAACASDLGAARGAVGTETPRARRLAHAARELLATRLAAPPSLDALAVELGTDARSLSAAFAAAFGQSIAGYVAEARLVAARERLENTDLPIKQIAAEVGYAYVSNFSAAFARRFRASPAQLRRRARG